MTEDNNNTTTSTMSNTSHTAGDHQESRPDLPLDDNHLTDASLRSKFFGRTEGIWGVAAPIAIRGLTVKKSLAAAAAAATTDEPTHSTAPTVLSAIIGPWLAKKLGCGGLKPQAIQGYNSSGSLASSCNWVIGNVNTVLNPGEATLIIAPSSSGKTTLMRTIADLCEGRDVKGLEGSVRIGGLDPTAKENEGCFRRSTAFADQGDLTLTPVLTVQETLEFAARCADPSEDEQEALKAILRLSGIAHVAGTVVGDANIRGVSGGQKRRVKVLEKAVGSQVRVLMMDEITNGLDAASALASCQNVTVAVEKTGITAICSLLQPSLDMYEVFHRVIVLTQQGEVAYSGMRTGALQHFESLGLHKPQDMQEPEFLLRCAFKPTDFVEAEDGIGITTSSDLAKLFLESPAGEALMKDIDLAEATKSQTPPTKKKDFAQPASRQLSLLLGRHWKLVVRNPGTFIRVVFMIIFGLFIGTLFLNTKGTEAGTRVRAGYAFTSLLLLFMTGATSPIEATVDDRGTFYCHRQARFYNTWTYYVANAICSIPLTIAESTLMALLSFFFVGMNSRGGPGFFYFWLIVFLLELCGTAVARCLSYSMPSTDMATTLGPAINIVFTLSAGFSPQYANLGWMQFLSWISPIGYGMEGMIVNELHARTIDGTGENGVDYAQRELGMPRIPYDQALAFMRSPTSLMAFDAIMIAVFWIFFELLGVFLLHASQKWYGPSTKRYQVTSGMSLGNGMGAQFSAKAFTKKFGKQSSLEVDIKPTEPAAVPPAPMVHLTAKAMVYEVDYKAPKENLAEKPNEGKRSSTRVSTNHSADMEDGFQLVTTREFGQYGKGAAQEWVLGRTVGDQALSRRSISTRSGSLVEPLARSLKQSVAPLRQSAIGGSFVAELDPPAPGRLRLLTGVSASFKPKTMTALMGSSGAGKTTLLDVVAGYKTGGYISGDICLNNKAKENETWRAVAGYCEQSDLHNPALTVRESLIFSARMRLRPFTLPESTRVSHVEEIMKLLKIEEYADVIVGDEAAGEGLPKHARKRLTLGTELVANPSILFADEPTSGLDSVSASLVISCLRKAAIQRNVTVVCTIHQPSKEVFEAFDNLLLLRKGGVCVYNGPVSKINEYMVSATGNESYNLQPNVNPADHALDIFCGPGGEKDDWGKRYKQAAMAIEVDQAINACTCEQCKSRTVNVRCETKPFMDELKEVLRRQLLSHWRTPTYMAVRFWWTVFATFFVGFMFMGIQKTTKGAFDVIGAMFNFINLATIPLTTAAVPLISERAVFYRETASATYRKSVYGIAVQLAEHPFNLVFGFISFLCYYWMIGLDTSKDKVLYFLLTTLAAYWVLPLYGQLFSFLSPNLGIAAVLAGLIMVGFTMTMGFLIPPASIPVWYVWLYWFNPMRYLLQGVAANELQGNIYLDEVSGRYVSGEDLLDNLGGWDPSTKWWYCYAAVLMFGFAGVTGVMLATRISWLKR